MFRRKKKVSVTARQFSAVELGRRGIAVSRETGLYAVEISVQGAKGCVSCIFSAGKSLRGKELTLRQLRFKKGVLRGIAHVPKGEVRWGIYVHNQLAAEGGLVVKVMPAELPKQSIPRGMGGDGNGHGLVRFWFSEAVTFSVRAVMVEMADDKRAIVLHRGMDGWEGFGRVAESWFRFRVVGETGVRQGNAMKVTEIGWDIEASSEWGLVSHWCRMEGGVAEVVKVQDGGTAWSGEIGIARNSPFWNRDNVGWKGLQGFRTIPGQERKLKLTEYEDGRDPCKEMKVSMKTSQRMMFTYKDTNNEIVALSVAYQALEPRLSRNVQSFNSLAKRHNFAANEQIEEEFANAEMFPSPRQGLAKADRVYKDFSRTPLDDDLTQPDWPLEDDIAAEPRCNRLRIPSTPSRAEKFSESCSFETVISDCETRSTVEPWESRGNSVLSSGPPSPYVISDRSGSSSPMSESLSNEPQRSTRIFDRAARMFSSLRSHSWSSKGSMSRITRSATSGKQTPPINVENPNQESVGGQKTMPRRGAEGRMWSSTRQENCYSGTEQAVGMEEEQFARGLDRRHRRVKDVLIKAGKVFTVAFLTLAAERILSRRGGNSRRQSLDGSCSV
eukprot:GFKZ01002544.1.p1 GENE.GFKZ01002544.1~~GFKZ01002544.1.p1  ORF type:complete len:613 (+),score=62.29 GFKZ01002544.1:1905-3743(+)